MSARAAMARAADAALAAVGPVAGPGRAYAEAGGVACLVLVWPAGGRLPTARAAEAARRRGPAGRAKCRAAAVAALRAAGRPLTRKELAAGLRATGGWGRGTVAKALADLTRAGELANPRDGVGYRLPAWLTPRPTLFPT